MYLGQIRGSSIPSAGWTALYGQKSGLQSECTGICKVHFLRTTGAHHADIDFANYSLAFSAGVR